jgi:hypothetical protein
MAQGQGAREGRPRLNCCVRGGLRVKGRSTVWRDASLSRAVHGSFTTTPIKVRARACGEAILSCRT